MNFDSWKTTLPEDNPDTQAYWEDAQPRPIPQYAPDNSLERLIKLALMELLPEGEIVTLENRRDAQKEVVRIVESWVKRESDTWRSIKGEGPERVANSLEIMRQRIREPR